MRDAFNPEIFFRLQSRRKFQEVIYNEYAVCSIEQNFRQQIFLMAEAVGCALF